LLPDRFVADRLLDDLEQAVGKDDHHVADASILHDLGEERAGFAAVVVAQEVAQHLQCQVTLEIENHVLA